MVITCVMMKIGVAGPAVGFGTCFVPVPGWLAYHFVAAVGDAAEFLDIHVRSPAEKRSATIHRSVRTGI